MDSEKLMVVAKDLVRKTASLMDSEIPMVDEMDHRNQLDLWMGHEMLTVLTTALVIRMVLVTDLAKEMATLKAPEIQLVASMDHQS